MNRRNPNEWSRDTSKPTSGSRPKPGPDKHAQGSDLPNTSVPPVDGEAEAQRKYTKNIEIVKSGISKPIINDEDFTIYEAPPTQIRGANHGGLEKTKAVSQSVDSQVANLLELAKSTTKSDNFYVHIIWLIDGLKLWYDTKNDFGHSPEDCKRYVISSILNHEQGNDLPTKDPKANSRSAKALKAAEYKQLLTSLPEKRGTRRKGGLARDIYGKVLPIVLENTTPTDRAYNEALDQCRAIIQKKIKEME